MFFQRFKNAGLADAREVVFSCGLEPLVHIELDSRVVFIENEVFDWLRSSAMLTESVVPPQPEREAA